MKTTKNNRRNKALNKLDKIIRGSDLDTLQDIVVFQNEEGVYEAFGTYRIARGPTGAYRVTIPTTFVEKTAYSLKNAMAWCIFDKQNKIYEADRILELDHNLGGLEVDLAIHQKMFQAAKNDDTRLIYVAKLTQDRERKKQMSDELTKYIDESKRWQDRRFSKPA
jgi:hypothetical protein